MNEQDALKIMTEVMQDKTPLVVNTSIVAAWMAVSAIQLATRHPNISDAQIRLINQAARDIQESIVAKHPKASDVLEMGWDPARDVDQNGVQVTEVHHAWTIYGMDDDETEAEMGFAQLGRPQDWGNPKWHYEKFVFQWEREDAHYIQHVYCWTDLKRGPNEYKELFAPLVTQIMLPGENKEWCGKTHLHADDFWQAEWGEMPTIFEDITADY